jgi:tetratricopeptide (TPR) repeat protein
MNTIAQFFGKIILPGVLFLAVVCCQKQLAPGSAPVAPRTIPGEMGAKLGPLGGSISPVSSDHNRWADIRSSLDQGSTESAKKALIRLIKSEPDNLPARLMLGKIYKKAGLTKLAIRHLQAAHELDPESAESLALLGELYLGSSNWKLAIENYLQMVNEPAGGTVVPGGKKGKNSELFAHIARAYKKSGNGRTGTEYFDKALRLDPNNRQLRSELAETWRSLREWDKAIAEYRRLIEMDPDEPEPYGRIGEIYSAAGRRPAAIEFYRTALEKSPAMPELYQLLGNFLLKDKRLDEAALVFQKLISLDPANVEAAMKLGLIELKTGDEKEALAIIQKSLGGHPDSAKLYFQMGGILCLMGQWESAKKAYFSALEKGYERGVVLSRLSYVEEKIRFASLTMDELRAMIVKYPQQTALRRRLIGLAIKQNNERMALTELLAYRQQFPMDPYALLGLGNLARHQGKLAAALPWYRQALDLAPNDRAVMKKVAQCAFLLGQYQVAEPYLISILAQEPNDLSTRLRLAKCYKNTDRNILARQLLEPAVAAPNGVTRELKRLLGSVYIAEKDWPKASAFLAKILPEFEAEADRPEYTEILNMLAYARLAEEKFELALAAYQQLLPLSETKGAILIKIGQCQEQLGNTSAAKASYAEAAKLDQDAAEPYERAGRLALQQRQFAAAVTFYQEASRREPKNLSHRINLAQAFKEMADVPASLAELGRAKANQPQGVSPRLALAEAMTEGRAALLKGDWLAARDRFAAAVAVDPANNSARMEYLLASGRLAKAEGNLAAALPPLEEAVRLNPTAHAAHLILGNAYLAAKRYKEAQRELTQATTLRPDNVHGHFQLGLLLVAIKNPSEAQKQFEQCLKLDPKGEIGRQAGLEIGRLRYAQ